MTSYTFEWATPNQVLKANLPSNFEDSLARLFDDDVLGYLDAADAPIYLLVDLREVKVHPKISTIMSWKHLNHPKLKHVIIIGLANNPIARFASNIVIRATGLNIISASTPDEAFAILSHRERSDS